MNRINTLFSKKKKNILSVYFTAGFPQLNDTETIIAELQNNGVDIIEIGMPFSDPLADGPTIQQSGEKALVNGMSIKVLLKQLRNLKNRNNELPLILMGYLNPVMQYGIENFCKDAAEVGIDGIILPDLPMQEYLDEYKSIFEKYGLKNIFLITPQTNESRIRFIDEHSDGFIYMVSSASITGTKEGIGSDQETYFKRIQSMNLNNPLIIGFGISDKNTFSKACEYANGAIIGSAFIKAIDNTSDLKSTIQEFVESIV